MTNSEPNLEQELEYGTDYEVGQDNVEVLGLDVHNPVFFLAATLVLLFSGLTLMFPQEAGAVLASAKANTLQSFDWLFAATPVIVSVFCIGLAVSPLGRIRLGGQDAKPDFKLLS
ncbi:MAG: BCCT family transporter, partial [Henriciella sp.]